MKALAQGLGALGGEWAPWSHSLRQGLGPWSMDLAPSLRKAHLQHLLWGLQELWALARRPWPAGQALVVEGLDGLKEALAGGRGAVLVGAHQGQWELVAAALRAEGLALTALVQPPTQAWAARFFGGLHRQTGLKEAPVMQAGGAPSALRPALRALRAGELLGALVDQHGEAQRAHGRLLGQPVALPTGAFALAKHRGAPLLPFLVLRAGPQAHHLVFGPPRWPTGDEGEDARWAMAWVEAGIRLQPSSWLWVHQRFARALELPAKALQPEGSGLGSAEAKAGPS